LSFIYHSFQNIDPALAFYPEKPICQPKNLPGAVRIFFLTLHAKMNNLFFSFEADMLWQSSFLLSAIICLPSNHKQKIAKKG